MSEPPITAETTGGDWLRRRVAVRCFAASLALALLFNVPLRLRHYGLAVSLSIDEPFFPSWWRSGWVAVSGYALCLSAVLLVLVRPSRRLTRVAAAAICLGSVMNFAHPWGFYWQTFTCAFWGSAWLAWLATRSDESLPTCRSAATMAQLVCSFVFMGAAMGKWTDGYWSGDVLYHLFFLYQSGQPFAWARESLEPSQVRQLATYFSRLAVVGETALAMLPLLPPRLSLPLFVAGALAMWSLSPLGVIDAIAPLIGLAAAGWTMLAPSNTAGPACGELVFPTDAKAL